MAKTPKVKKRGIYGMLSSLESTDFRTEVSFRSRAARRGASPPAKPLTATKAQAKETEYKPWLHNAQNAGITKKQKVKPLKRQQKVRQQKAMEKADAVVDKLERKVADSKARSKRIQSRAKAWDELNARPAKVEKTLGEEGALSDGMTEEGDGHGMEDVEVAEPESAVTVVDPSSAALATATAPEVEEEIDEVT